MEAPFEEAIPFEEVPLSVTEEALTPPVEPPATEEETPTDAPAPTEPSIAPDDVPDYAAMAAADLAEIKRLDPAYAPATHLGELPFARRFAELRDKGLSVEEALAAAVPRFSRHDSRAHLQAVSIRGAKAPAGTLSREEMKEARALFSGLSEEEIHTLYRRVSKQSNAY